MKVLAHKDKLVLQAGLVCRQDMRCNDGSGGKKRYAANMVQVFMSQDNDMDIILRKTQAVQLLFKQLSIPRKTGIDQKVFLRSPDKIGHALSFQLIYISL